jgi:hypothetical protein
MAKTRKQRSKIALFPKDEEVKSARRKLPIFHPHDLRSLISEAKTHDMADVDTAFLLAFRRRNDTQVLATVTHTVPVEASGVRHDEPRGACWLLRLIIYFWNWIVWDKVPGCGFEELALKRANHRHLRPSRDPCVGA